MRLLVLTGQRKTQISALRWEEINFADAQLELPAGRMKGRRAHIVALAPMALEILKQRTPRAVSPYAFGRDSGPFVGWAKSKSDLDKKMGDEVQENWTVHDLRRTWSTHASERLAIPQHIVNAVLGHKLGGVRGVYNRSQYLSERRAALEAYAIYIAKIVGSDQR